MAYRRRGVSRHRRRLRNGTKTNKIDAYRAYRFGDLSLIRSYRRENTVFVGVEEQRCHQSHVAGRVHISNATDFITSLNTTATKRGANHVTRVPYVDGVTCKQAGVAQAIPLHLPLKLRGRLCPRTSVVVISCSSVDIAASPTYRAFSSGLLLSSFERHPTHRFGGWLRRSSSSSCISIERFVSFGIGGFKNFNDSVA